MIKFLKYTLATLVGGIVAAIVIIIIFIGIIAGIASMGAESETIKDNTMLVLKLNGPIVERTSDNPFDDIIANLSDEPETAGLNHILANIKKASNDPQINGILLESGMLSTGYATVEEIRNALIEFKKSGKFIYSFAPIYTQKSYYLASVADKIYLAPSGMVEFQGIHSQNIYFKGTLEKLGIEMQIFKHGKFKSAVEPFINDKMSDEARQQSQVYTNSIWMHVKSKISESRQIDVNQLDALADEMPMFLDPTKLVEARLIDGLKYKDELIDELKSKTNTNLKDDLNSVSNSKYTHAIIENDSIAFSKEKIAIIYAEGAIDGGDSEGIDSEKLSKTIRKARRDSTIKAIVLRINSPGGSALGSDIIWREVKLAKQTKPVVVSMGDLAASGGYYIACAADSIVAHPTTLTGSIGIFGIIPNAKGLFDKMGLTFDGVKTNKYADMPALVRPFNADEKILLQAYIERGYDMFISRCADGRNTSKDSINLIGQGRVWTGSDASTINLIDKQGGIADAIAIAQRMAKLNNYRIVELPEAEDPFEEFMKSIGGDAKAWLKTSMFGEEFQYFEQIKAIKNSYPIQARMPYNVLIN